MPYQSGVRCQHTKSDEYKIRTNTISCQDTYYHMIPMHMTPWHMTTFHVSNKITVDNSHQIRHCLYICTVLLSVWEDFTQHMRTSYQAFRGFSEFESDRYVYMYVCSHATPLDLLPPPSIPYVIIGIIPIPSWMGWVHEEILSYNRQRIYL